MNGRISSVFLFLLVNAAATVAVAEEPETFGFGSPATEEEIAAWDIDVMPDGTGLPEGSGTVAAGEAIYAAQCSVCHGKTGVEGPNDQLVVETPNEGFPDSRNADTWQHRHIGNYWPYATTVFDYILRSMPMNVPGSLSADEVYSLTAYLLYLNHIVPEDAVMSRSTLPQVVMPAKTKFVVDDRHEYKEVH